MPVTIKNYIAGVNDKNILTPMSAMRKAFEYLELATSVKDIKDMYPNEPLFKDLKSINDTKTGNGIIGLIKRDNEILSLNGESILKDNSDITVYLVKKIFLENKTFAEINEDLENDLHEDFKADFKYHNPDSEYAKRSTLAALGIKAPNADFRNSLRFTQEGYSDLMGERVSTGLSNFWNGLSIEERSAKAKKSVLNFENWWTSLSQDAKLDKIAAQASVLDMLKDYKEFKAENTLEKTQDTVKQNEEEKSNNITSQTNHTKVGSNALSSDDLFLQWASNNLKIFLASLTEEDKDALHVKRIQLLTSRWQEMSPAEKAEYISKMKAGQEPLRYTMIDTWNHSPEIIKALSEHLKENQIYKPADILYATEEFSSFQSQVMTEFWAKYPEYAKLLGKNMVISNEKIKKAIANGTFEELKKEILRDKEARIKEFLKSKEIENTASATEISPNEVPDEIPLGIYDGQYIEDVKRDPANIDRYNNAHHAAFAKAMYYLTKTPLIYSLGQADMEEMLDAIIAGEEGVATLTVGDKNEVLDISKIQVLFNDDKFATFKKILKDSYKGYREPISEGELDRIYDSYLFIPKGEKYKEKLKDYYRSYGKSLEVLFSPKNIFPDTVKEAMLEKLEQNMPQELADNTMCFYTQIKEPFQVMKSISKIQYDQDGYLSRYLPQNFVKEYIRETTENIKKGILIGLNSDPVRKADTEKQLEDIRNYQGQAGFSFIRKFELPVDTQLKVLAMENALSDVFYAATKNPNMYQTRLEDFGALVDEARYTKEYPTKGRCSTSESPIGEYTLYKRPNLSSLVQKYINYYNELKEYVNSPECKNGIDNEEIICILNPDETQEAKDKALAMKMDMYFELNK